MKELNSLPEGTLLVTRQDKFGQLIPPAEQTRYEVLVRGRLGRRDALLLRAK